MADGSPAMMRRAIDLSAERMRANLGGPFGAVITKDGEIVAELLKSIDDLDLALAHCGDGDAVQNLANGVRMVRDKFLETLLAHGVQRMEPDGETFDPNTAEAIRVDPVEDEEMNGKVTATLRPGYRLGDRIIRAAQVAVGRK